LAVVLICAICEKPVGWIRGGEDSVRVRGICFGCDRRLEAEIPKIKPAAIKANDRERKKAS
jgi:hypothetical protein